MKRNNDYYIGLDMGTNSVGWATTNPQGRLLRFNKKTCGAHAFLRKRKQPLRRVPSERRGVGMIA